MMRSTSILMAVHLALALVLALVTHQYAVAQTREEKVRNDKAKVEADGFWIYNDLARGIEAAKKSGKPLVVVLRCIPCEECVKLDDELVDKDERLRPLLEQFERVRIVSTNGLDLSLFQFDTDQSFAVFLLNADSTIYGRFGTRSDHKEWVDDVSVEGLGKALEGALALHRRYPEVKPLLAAKRGPAPDFQAPEQYPTLKGKFGPKLDYSGNVVRSCIHCHQIGDAQREYYRTKESKIPEKVLFPYPHPKAIGLVLNPRERATVLRVAEGSIAEKAGFKAGDVMEYLEGQPLLSIADVQWVLHHVDPQGGTLVAKVKRGDATEEIKLTLPAGWRASDDISWRASTWGLRRFGFGGLNLKPLTDEERGEKALTGVKLALRVHHVGAYAPHDGAKRAGFLKDDVIIEFDGKADFSRESELLAHALNQRKPGDSIPVKVLRGGKTLDLKIPVSR
jgi:serine protease Do